MYALVAVPIPSEIRREHVLEALSALDSGYDHPFGPPTKFELHYNGRRYPPKAVVGVAARIATGSALNPADFSGGEAAGQANRFLEDLGFEVVSKAVDNEGMPTWAISSEGRRRWEAWRSLGSPGSAAPVPPADLRARALYGGAQGVFVGRELTVTPELPDGVTVSILHTGTTYPDELSEEGLIYHYPETRRAGSRDDSEIQATKNTLTLGVPVLLIVRPTPTSPVRNVRWTFLQEWDDKAKQFFFVFDDPAVSPQPVEEPFSPTAARKSRKRLAETRPGQARFRFLVFKRYGARCAVCDLDVPELLEAAHIVARQFDGCDDPRNGMVLCRNHHAAFDRGLFGVQPESLELRSLAGSTLDQLGVTRPSLDHLQPAPAREAFETVAPKRAQASK